MKIKSLRHNSLSWAIVKVSTIMVITLSGPCIAVADSSTVSHKRLAILSSEEVRESGLGDLLTVEMQKLPNVELVERDILRKVLDEVALSMMLAADQVENRRQAGALLKADILVLLSLEEAKDKKTIVKVVISDCSNGARLRIGWVPFNKGELENTCRDLTKVVHSTLVRFRDGVKQIVGVSHLVSRNLVHDYDHLQAGYAYLLQNALSSSPGVAVIEVEEARSIRHESELAGDMKSGRVVPLFVEGEFKMQRAASKKQTKVQITIRISDSAGAIKQIERKDLSMDKVAAFITDDAALTILKLSKSPSVQMLDKEQQLQALIRNADEFARLGEWAHSTGLREASVLLKPDFTEQRAKLVYEYAEIRLRSSWRPASEHLEYMIYNRLLDRGKALQLSSRVLTHLPYLDQKFRTRSRRLRIPYKPRWATEVESYRRDFLLSVHPEILKLKSSSTQTRYQQSEYASWYKILVQRALFLRLDGLFRDKEDLAFFLDLHNNAVPEGMGPSSYCVTFVKRDFYTEHYRQQPHRGRYEYSQQEFLDFLTALSHSEKTLSSFYGRYGLLYHKYCQRRHQGNAMDDLRDEAEQLVNEFKKDKFPLSTGHGYIVFHDEIVGLKQKIESAVSPTKLLNGTLAPKGKAVQAAKGRVVFEKIPMKFEDLSGNIHPTFGKMWRVSRGSIVEGLRGALKCGDSLDVMWGRGAILFMKEKGLLEEVIVDYRPSFDHLIWDGQDIWVGTRYQGIWLLDTSGKIVTKIGAESGLPPANKKIMLHPIEPGRVFATGSFGPRERAWCAIVEFKKGKASVNVFHEATRAPTDAEREKEDLGQDPFFAFSPYWIHEYQSKEKDRRIILVGRFTHGSYRSEILRCPLEIDLNKMSVRVSSYQMLKIRRRSGAYFSRNGILFGVDSRSRVGPFPNLQGHCVVCFSAPGTNWPNGETRKEICHCLESGGYNALAGYLLDYNGKIYVPGKTWFRFDPDTLEEERLVHPILPYPYSVLPGYWVSAHYGLVGWISHLTDYDFYQIKIADEDHVYGYFHIVVFEDENGPITSPAKLKRIYVDVIHQNKIIRQYKDGEFYNSVKNGGPLLPGTYKATMWLQQGANAKKREFELVEASEDSPEQLVFKVKSRAEILYCGQVVNAITGKPMEGAFVTVSDIPDLSPLTREQWIALHKLPANPYPADDALLPVHDLSVQNRIGRVVKTDRDGRFEMSFKVGDKAYSFAAFEEDYLSTEVTHFAFGPVKDGRVELPPMALFPAAKVKIYPCIEEYNSGKPCIEAANVNIDHWFNIDENYNPGWVSKFRKIYPRSTSRPSVAAPRPAMNEVDTYHVPAGLRFKIKLGIPQNNKWCIPDIPQTINLKQGETLDLGRVVFDSAIKVSIRVVNSAGYPIQGVWVRKLSGPFSTRKTDQNGLVGLYLEPNSKHELLVDFSKVYLNLRRTLILRPGIEKRVNKGFTVILLEDGTIQSIKSLEPTKAELAKIRQSQNKQSDVKTPATSKLEKLVFTTGLTKDGKPINNLTKTSINEKRIYIHTNWQLTLEKHDFLMKTFDGSGKLVNEDRTKSMPYCAAWCIRFLHNINKKTDKPGKWKFEIYLDGLKMAEKYLAVLP